MKLLLACTALLITVVGCAADGRFNALKPRGKPGAELTLAAGGKTGYTIVIPDSPTTQDRKAAEDLARWLREITGAEFSIISESAADPDGKFISIGRTNLLESYMLHGRVLPRSLCDLGSEGYAILQGGGNLFLLGGSRRGPINAVYALLEEDLGCRWYDRYTPDIPRMPELKVRVVPRCYNPRLDIRDPFYWDAFDPDWALRNRTNAPLVKIPEEWGGVTDYAWFGHSFDWLVPPDQYFADHPEYYSLVDGKRKPLQLCLTNPDVLRIAIEKIRAYLRQHPNSELVSVSQNDCAGYCECENCRGIDGPEGTPAATLIQFCNKIAEALRDEFPNVKVSTLAYMGTVKPPKTIRPCDRVVVQLCTDRHAWKRPFLTLLETEQFSSALKGWHSIGANTTIWHYTVNFHHYPIPMPNWQVVDRDIEILIGHGAGGIMLQGAYQSPGGENAAMRSWVWAKKLWDPCLDSKDLMRDFVFGYFREAAEPIWKYQMMLWDVWETNHAKPQDHNQMICGIRYYPDIIFLQREQYLDKALTLFAEARRLATDPVTKRRVDIAMLPILYVQICQQIGFVDYYGAFQPRIRTSSDRARLRLLIDEFEHISRIEKVTHIREGRPDLTDQISLFRKACDADPGDYRVIRLPESWKVKPELNQAGRNVRVYEQEFYVPEDWKAFKHVFVWFGGVGEEAVVYLNGKPAWEQSVRSTAHPRMDLRMRPFYFDATGRTTYENNRHPLLGTQGFEFPEAPYINYGCANTISVRVTSTGDPSGIHEPVCLVAT
ncbi:MAG: DUF4838 domain-containing protein, partial [Armatimonadota bacterium]